MLELSRHGKTVFFDDAAFARATPCRIRSHVARGKFYEEKFLAYIRSLGRRGVYVDAGAYIGTHALYFAVLCGAEHVHAFEPRPAPCEELERNVRLNGLESKITVYRQGLAADRRTVTLKMYRRQETFECVALDEAVRGPVDVIKIDVEGMELEVLKGASRILSESAPVVFAEAHRKRKIVALERLLEPFGYRRTGRVFNASPTFEFAKMGDEAAVRAELLRAYGDLDRLHAKLRRWQQGEEERLDEILKRNVRLEETVTTLRRQLEAARRSLGFRLGRATQVALRDARHHPLAVPRRWVEVFRGADEVLAEAGAEGQAGGPSSAGARRD